MVTDKKTGSGPEFRQFLFGLYSGKTFTDFIESFPKEALNKVFEIRLSVSVYISLVSKQKLNLGLAKNALDAPQ